MGSPFLQHAEWNLLRGLPDEALRLARMGLTLFPDDPELLELAATCAVRLGNDAYALACWQHLLDLDPSAVQVRNSLALVLERLKRTDEAESLYRQALAMLPDDANLHTNLGLLLENQDRLDEAEIHQRRALVLAPESAEIHSNLAGLLVRKRQAGEAEQLYRAALQLNPDFAVGHSNLGVLLTDCGRLEEATACFQAALAIDPEGLQVRMNLGELFLMQGRFAEGWPLYEGRQHVFAEAGQGPTAHPPSCPQWQGEPLAGKSIIVLPEQGMGDEIQFCRYLAWLKAQGPARVTLVCRPAQKALLQTLAGPDLLVDLNEAPAHLAGQDYWVFLLSLPLHAGTTLTSIPGEKPYLFSDPLRVARYSSLLAGEGLRVGLVWRGNPKHINDADRSLPDLKVLAPLWSVAGVRFFSLQKSEICLPAAPLEQPLSDLGPLLDDFADTAAILSQLDLLIAVDTSVAHLAGALGLPCWLLLPCYKTDWRWLHGRDDSPWYPKHRLFRQQERGAWAMPVEDMRQALCRLRDAAGES